MNSIQLKKLIRDEIKNILNESSPINEFRKGTDLVVSAFLSGKRAKAGNTVTDGTSMFLHGNEIARIDGNVLSISLGGYQYTVTTAEKLNSLPGVTLNKRGPRIILNGSDWDGDWIEVGTV